MSRRKFRRLDLPRLFIKYEVKNGGGQVRAISIPIKFCSNRTLGIAVRFWRYGRMTTSPASKQVYLKVSDEMPRIPHGYKWAIEGLTIKPDELHKYVGKLIDIVEHMNAEVLGVYLKRF